MREQPQQSRELFHSLFTFCISWTAVLLRASQREREWEGSARANVSESSARESARCKWKAKPQQNFVNWLSGGSPSTDINNNNNTNTKTLTRTTTTFTNRTVRSRNIAERSKQQPAKPANKTQRPDAVPQSVVIGARCRCHVRDVDAHGSFCWWVFNWLTVCVWVWSGLVWS